MVFYCNDHFAGNANHLLIIEIIFSAIPKQMTVINRIVK